MPKKYKQLVATPQWLASAASFLGSGKGPPPDLPKVLPDMFHVDGGTTGLELMVDFLNPNRGIPSIGGLLDAFEAFLPQRSSPFPGSITTPGDFEREEADESKNTSEEELALPPDIEHGEPPSSGGSTGSSGTGSSGGSTQKKKKDDVRTDEAFRKGVKRNWAGAERWIDYATGVVPLPPGETFKSAIETAERFLSLIQEQLELAKRHYGKETVTWVKNVRDYVSDQIKEAKKEQKKKTQEKLQLFPEPSSHIDLATALSLMPLPATVMMLLAIADALRQTYAGGTAGPMPSPPPPEVVWESILNRAQGLILWGEDGYQVPHPLTANQIRNPIPWVTDPSPLDEPE